MAGRCHQRGLLALTLGVTVWGSTAPALAAPDAVTGRTTERGVEIEVERFSPPRSTGGETAAPDATRGTGTGRRARCSLFPWLFPAGTAKGGIAPTPAHRRFLVSCDGQAVGTRWIGPADPLAATAAMAVDLAGVAQRVVREIPVGDVTIGHRPRTRAVTGVPTYMWVEGYDGRPLTRTVRELGATVDVRITLQQVTWDFGDGAPPRRAGLGEAWPARSSVHHTYERSTPRTTPAAITASLAFFAEYRVDGGPWHALAPITRGATTTLDVDEVQAVRRR